TILRAIKDPSSNDIKEKVAERRATKFLWICETCNAYCGTRFYLPHIQHDQPEVQGLTATLSTEICANNTPIGM
ncbi:hypothetical protein MKW98_027716, partial [Papaver atlanticum]